MLMYGGGRQCLFYHLILCYHTPSSRNTLLNKKEKKNFRGLLDTQLVFFVFFFLFFVFFFQSRRGRGKWVFSSFVRRDCSFSDALTFNALDFPKV